MNPAEIVQLNKNQRVSVRLTETTCDIDPVLLNLADEDAGIPILLAAQNDAFIESPFPRVTLEQRQSEQFLSERCFVKGINVGRARNNHC
jgi:hypothetical protein